ncbi:hypothetical protein [Dactylosporangium matsuzakiense]|nr:hypothetical protein [Dactylosporangium matsuzakiense]UWZ42091.1 hypothetical protein Dmats_31385 [Dactylosporangium matsuzakiense]
MRTRIMLALVAAGTAAGLTFIASQSAIGLPPPLHPSASPSMEPPSAYPSPVVSGPGAQAVDCATIPRLSSGALPQDAGGEFIAYGADTVTRCDTLLQTPGPTVAPPEVLHRAEAVTSFVRLLNSLPAPPADQACLRVAFTDQLSFVVTFAPPTRKRPLIVVVDRNCAALLVTENFATRVRSYASLDPMPLFEQLYRAQPPN